MVQTEDLKQYVVVVDPWSTGYTLAKEFIIRNTNVLAVWTNEEFARNQDEFFVNIFAKTLENTMDMIKEALPKDVELVGIVPGAESGVIMADELAFEFGTRMNPFELSIARRNKYIMGETIRNAGVRAVQQRIASDWSTVKSFLDEWNPSPYKVIVKPNQSAGSDDVFLCNSEQEVKEAFEKINGSINHLGCINEGVLIQEYLQGTEFVVDTMSRDGEHKICALWQYDKRHANDQFNVYFGMKPVVVSSDMERAIVEYIFQVLDGLKFENGPGHAEVKFTSNGPVLIEIGSRCHGGEGEWKILSDKAFGWNQISRTAELYLNPESFDNYPNYPTEMIQYCVNLDFVSYVSGTIESIPGEKVLKSLPSIHNIRWEVKCGDKLTPTIDLFSSPGQVQLIHNSKTQVDADYALIHSLLLDGFFVLKSDKEQEYVDSLQPQES